MRRCIAYKKVLDEFSQNEYTHITSTQIKKENISRIPKPRHVFPSNHMTPPPGLVTLLILTSTDSFPDFALYLLIFLSFLLLLFLLLSFLVCVCFYFPFIF